MAFSSRASNNLVAYLNEASKAYTDLSNPVEYRLLRTEIDGFSNRVILLLAPFVNTTRGLATP